MYVICSQHSLFLSRTPCGFCFVEFYTNGEALAALRYVSGTKLDERIIRCDLDLGYREGRQFGRGKSGGQVRDEHRADYDPGRGGWGAQAQRAEIERRREVEERYQDVAPGSKAAGGGEDWAQKNVQASVDESPSKKRERSPDDEGDNEAAKQVSFILSHCDYPFLTFYSANDWTGRRVCETCLCICHCRSCYFALPLCSRCHSSSNLENPSNSKWCWCEGNYMMIRACINCR